MPVLPDDTTTFRDAVDHMLLRYRTCQICAFVVVLSTFFVIPFVRFAAIGTIIGVGVFLRVYWLVRHRLRCPDCSADLSFFVIDPSYAGTPGALILPPRLPQKAKRCPACGLTLSSGLGYSAHRN